MGECTDVNCPDNYFMNISNCFTCEISTSTETKAYKKKPIRVATVSKTETEQVLRLILRFLLICFSVFRVHAHAG